MKTIDEREAQKQQRRKRTKGDTEAIVKGWQLNNFVVHLS